MAYEKSSQTRDSRAPKGSNTDQADNESVRDEKDKEVEKAEQETEQE